MGQTESRTEECRDGRTEGKAKGDTEGQMDSQVYFMFITQQRKKHVEG